MSEQLGIYVVFPGDLSYGTSDETLKTQLRFNKTYLQCS